MLHLAVQDIGDGLDPAMGMPGEAPQILLRIVGMEIVQQEKRIQFWDVLEAERPFEMYPSPFQRRPAR
jgi:hypothetical protein